MQLEVRGLETLGWYCGGVGVKNKWGYYSDGVRGEGFGTGGAGCPME